MTLFLALLLTTLALSGAAAWGWKVYRQTWLVLAINLGASYIAWMLPEPDALLALAFIDVLCFVAMYKLGQKALAWVFAGMLALYGSAWIGVLGFPRPIADFVDVLVHIQHLMLIFMAWGDDNGGKRVGLVWVANTGRAVRGFAYRVFSSDGHHGHS